MNELRSGESWGPKIGEPVHVKSLDSTFRIDSIRNSGMAGYAYHGTRMPGARRCAFLECWFALSDLEPIDDGRATE